LVVNLVQNRTIVLFWRAMTDRKNSSRNDPLSAPEAGRRVLLKGQQTKTIIIDAALGLASQIGLEGLSIGAVAEVTGMSKSGVFAHFGSREELQISVIREYHDRFESEVFYAAMQMPRGVPRLQALFDNWMEQTSAEIDSGCIYISGAVEFDDRTGPVRDALASSVATWQTALRRAVELAQEEGQLSRESDAHQIAFEIHGLILALHYEARFLRNPEATQHARQGFQHILLRYAVSSPDAPSAPEVGLDDPIERVTTTKPRTKTSPS
jgi:AcrR family transcriptional regulator